MATPKKLADLRGADGGAPFGSLLGDADGGIDGVGGAPEISDGSIGGAITTTVLVSFDGADGAIPEGSLIADAKGDLFGATAEGGAYGVEGGTVFEVAKTATGYAAAPTVLVGFDGADGERPVGALISDAAGDLFGTTEGELFNTVDDGGANPYGTVFEIAKTATGYASTPDVLVSFRYAEGEYPTGSLIADANGDLFGAATSGGASGGGTVFELAKTATGYAGAPTVLVSLDPASDGDEPSGSLLADARGDLFGATSSGGPEGGGTVFEIAKTATGYAGAPTVLISFDGLDGRQPSGSLIADAAGDLFGTTALGGANGEGGGAPGFGTVFEIAKTATGYASTPTVLVSFDALDGSDPVGGLIADADGDLFGATELGGPNMGGAVFEIAKTAAGYASTPTVLTSFDATAAGASVPEGGLLADAEGDLFGTDTGNGDPTFGTVFEITGSGYEVPCFCRGARILTPRGEIAVERLAAGDLVTTLSGEVRPLTWIGRGRSLVTAANPHARPIIVREGALADGVPARDLHLTRGHSLLLDGVLIPVEYLVNDRSIAWDRTARVVEFYHLELDCHDVLLAEGACAESYREDGNRHLFHNADAPLHARADMPAYAPVLTGGPEVDRVWARLLARAAPPEATLTEDADLHLLADGARVDGQADGLVHRFRLERAPFELRLRSRVCNPVRLGTGRDPRDLGAAVRRIVLRSEGVELALGWDSPWLDEGFNGPEAGNAVRWTTGDGLVPSRALAAFDGPVDVELELGMTTRYPVCAAAAGGPEPMPALEIAARQAARMG